MRHPRRTTPRVKDGQVQRKHRDRREADYRPTHQVRIERSKPRRGRRHFVSISDVAAFLPLLPDWDEIAVGLQRVLLSRDDDCDGWHSPGTVAICAWDDFCVQVVNANYYAEHAEIFRRMRVPCRPVVYRPGLECLSCWANLDPDDWSRCGRCGASLADAYPAADHNTPEEERRHVVAFTPATVQAFLLVHVLVHELGHHHDRMTSPRKRRATRGEDYAEAYAKKHEDALWPAYCRVFQPFASPA